MFVAGFVADAVTKLLIQVPQREGSDRPVQRGGIKREPQRSQYDPARTLVQIVHDVLMLFLLSTTFRVLAFYPINDHPRAPPGVRRHARRRPAIHGPTRAGKEQCPGSSRPAGVHRRRLVPGVRELTRSAERRHRQAVRTGGHPAVHAGQR
jgi:hypothetical protein